MRKVIIESPYKGNLVRNREYARLAMKDSLDRGEAPLLSHLLYTQVLDDSILKERKLGINAGHAWIESADAVIIYEDYGISDGMRVGILRATRLQIPVEYRRIYNADHIV